MARTRSVRPSSSLALEHEAALDLGELASTRRVVRVQFLDGEGVPTLVTREAVKGTRAYLAH